MRSSIHGKVVGSIFYQDHKLPHDRFNPSKIKQIPNRLTATSGEGSQRRKGSLKCEDLYSTPALILKKNNIT
jgi:hypothetical protein